MNRFGTQNPNIRPNNCGPMASRAPGVSTAMLRRSCSTLSRRSIRHCREPLPFQAAKIALSGIAAALTGLRALAKLNNVWSGHLVPSVSCASRVSPRSTSTAIRERR